MLLAQNQDLEKQHKLHRIRHSAAHIMAQAVRDYFQVEIRFGSGPAIEDGFYYDFELPRALIPDDLPAIEDRMRKIMKESFAFEREDLSLDAARELFRNQPYKLELIESIAARDDALSVYKHADFVDLCRGPHVPDVSAINPKTFKLMRIAGAYWKGDEKRPMLQRIYGVAFASEEELNAYLERLREAERRDHRKIGKEQDLFFFDESAPGMPYWLPKGLHILNELLNWWRLVHRRERYQEISSPLLNEKKLWEQSGHWEHYKDEMFLMESKNAVYGLKPMNCPNAMIVFNHRSRSYRDLPLRLSDCDALHRKERSGCLHGLLRVQKFQQDDAHIFIADEMDAIAEEYDRILKLVDEFYRVFGLNYRFRMGSKPKDAMGEADLWVRAESALKGVLERHCPDGYEIAEGDGAFYGPKIDILIQDALGRDWQMGTIQLDFQLPRRFNCAYAAKDGQRRVPAVIHRVIYGSMERFIGILLEHCEGRLPLWLSAEQVRVIPIADRHQEGAQRIQEVLVAAGILAECDEQAGSMGSKIRRFQVERVPYAILIGDQELESGLVAVRGRNGEMRKVSLPSFIDEVLESIGLKN